MRAFTVYQPYAYAIVAGLKQYETRPRQTHIRGRVAVHAAKGKPRFVTLAVDMALPEQMKLHFGAVVGTVEIVDCLPVEEIVHTLAERERTLGDYSPGRWAWVLKNPVIFNTPIPASGETELVELERSRRMSGEIARAALDGARVAITPDCWPCRGTAECIRVSMTKQTWNGVRTLNRKIPVGMTPEQMDEAIARTVEEMTAAIETPGNWKG